MASLAIEEVCPVLRLWGVEPGAETSVCWPAGRGAPQDLRRDTPGLPTGLHAKELVLTSRWSSKGRGERQAGEKVLEWELAWALQ